MKRMRRNHGVAFAAVKDDKTLAELTYIPAPPFDTQIDNPPRLSIVYRTLKNLTLLLKYFWRREVWH